VRKHDLVKTKKERIGRERMARMGVCGCFSQALGGLSMGKIRKDRRTGEVGKRPKKEILRRNIPKEELARGEGVDTDKRAEFSRGECRG